VRCSEQEAWGRQRAPLPVFEALARKRLDDSEVAEERVTVPVEQDVRGLYVAVEVVLSMDEVQSLGNVRQPGEQRRNRHRPYRVARPRVLPVLQAPALEVLHHHERPTIVLADVNDPDDMRMT